MLNILWLGLIVFSVICGMITGRIPEVVASVTGSAKTAFELSLGLTGIMTFWLGIMKIAEEGGLLQLFARVLRPFMQRLFPGVPSDHPASGAIILNLTANLLGLANAATPFGLRAMRELETLNKTPGTATNDMCMFLAINTAGFQLIPTTAIAFLAAGGASQPTDIILTSLIATACGTTAAILSAKIFQRFSFRRTASSASITETP